MADICAVLTEKYEASLKAEHGTGRNMAPFVELEWGREAYRLMRRIKDLFDPANLLNPGVIINPDPKAHITNLKPLRATHPFVDKCTECGFCEPVCPSRRLSLTPRQRIAAWREIEFMQGGKQRDKLTITRLPKKVAIHVTCSARKMGHGVWGRAPKINRS